MILPWRKLRLEMKKQRRQEPFYGDTINSLAREHKDFHCSLVYRWYSNLFEEEKTKKKVWSSRVAKAGCMPKAFDFRELVL